MSNCVKCGTAIIVDYRVENPMCWSCYLSCNPLEDQPSLIPMNCIGSSNRVPHARCIGSSNGVPDDINMGCSGHFFNDHGQTTRKVVQKSDHDSEEVVSRLIKKI